MKHLNILGSIRFLAVLVAGAILFTSSAVAFDSTPPKVESCTISPRQVSDVTGGNVRVTIKVVSKNGLSTDVVSVLNLKNNTSGATRQLGGFIMRQESGDEFSGTWIQDIVVKPGLMPGIYELSIFPLTDKVQNGTFFIGCPGQEVSYGVVTPAPTPTPIVKVTPAPGTTVYVTNPTDKKLADLVKRLQSQLTLLNLKLKKICAAKPKPKGC